MDAREVVRQLAAIQRERSVVKSAVIGETAKQHLLRELERQEKALVAELEKPPEGSVKKGPGS